MKKHVTLKNCTLTEAERHIWLDISDKLECKDKSSLPPMLKHLDKGRDKGLIFPSDILLPFMRMSDIAFKECSSEENRIKFAGNIASVIKVQMHNHVLLKEEFNSVITAVSNDATSMTDRIFKFWVEKMCNLRIKDTILVAAEKLELNETKNITTKTQNLRDKLLTKHAQE